jgi:hypothetical protein
MCDVFLVYVIHPAQEREAYQRRRNTHQAKTQGRGSIEEGVSILLSQ